MRVLFVVPPRFGLHRGGLEIQIEKTAAELQAMDVDVVKYNPWRDELSGADVCHGFTFDGSILPYALEASRRNVPFVISPVSNLVSVSRISITSRIFLSKYIPGVFSDLKRAVAISRCAQVAVAQTELEANLLHRAFGVSKEHIEIVPNGLARTSKEGNSNLFFEKYGLRDFVLCVGSIDRNKNQETLIRAVKGRNLQLVLVGRAAVGQENYEQHCRKLADDNVLFTGFIEPGNPIIASAFAAARVVAVPSFMETWGLAMYEGALAGCHLAVSSTIPLHEVIARRVKIIGPKRVKQWSRVLEELCRTPVSRPS